MAKAEKRLSAYRTPASKASIKSISDDFCLKDEAQLALKLLGPKELQELMAGEAELRVKLSQVPDPNHVILTLVKLLDAEVEELVRGLSALDGSSEGVSDEATTATGGADDLMAEVEARLTAANRSPSTKAAVEKLSLEHGLSEDVQLALRLLSQEHLDELLAGGDDLEQKLWEVPDKSELIRSLVGMLDPEVMRLVNGVKELDGEGEAAESKPVAVVPKGAQSGLHAAVKRTAEDTYAAVKRKAEETQTFREPTAKKAAVSPAKAVVPKAVVTPKAVVAPKASTAVAPKAVSPVAPKAVTPVAPKAVTPVVTQAATPAAPTVVTPVASTVATPAAVTPAAPKASTEAAPKASTAVAPIDAKASTAVEPKAKTAVAPKAKAAAAGGGGAESPAPKAAKKAKGPKCMICQGPHRAADCPKNQ